MASAGHPFQCSEQGCGASYKRKEYLIRHIATHQAIAHACPYCDNTFGRKDSVRRHILLHHRNKPAPARIRAPNACSHCKVRKTRCDGGMPCGYCLCKGLRCVYNEGSPDLQRTSPSAGEGLARHVETYFRHFHPTWPFLHRALFRVSEETPLLVQAVVMVGLWESGEEGARRAARELHGQVMVAVEAQRDKWDVSDPDRIITVDDEAWPMGTYQAILLFLIFATMARSRLAPQQLSELEYEVLVALIRSCKRRGMFHYPEMHAQYDRSGVNQKTVMYIWVGVEEAKRFALAVYQVWRMCKDRRLAEDRGEDLLTMADLKFPMPAGEHLWMAESKVQFLGRVTEAVDCGKFPCNHKAEWICDGKGT